MAWVMEMLRFDGAPATAVSTWMKEKMTSRHIILCSRIDGGHDRAIFARERLYWQ